MSGTPVTERHLAQFLDLLSEEPNVARACRLIGKNETTLRTIRAKDEQFATAWDAAIETGIQRIEEELHRRAVRGIDKPLVHQGQMTFEVERDVNGRTVFESVDIGDGEMRRMPKLRLDEHGQPIPVAVKEYSDSLMTFLLKAHRPDRYRERTDVNVTGKLDIAGLIHEARKRVGGG